MSLLRTLRKGASGSLSTYRFILLMWLITLVTILLVAVPLKTGMKDIFGHSMIISRFRDGFDLGLAGDMGMPLRNLVSSMLSGSILLLITGFFLYQFFAGGLFTAYVSSGTDMNVSSLFKAATRNFLPFLFISLIMGLIIAIYTFLVAGIPAAIAVSLSDGAIPDRGVVLIPYLVWFLGLPVWLLVADYSRRWIAATGSRRVFRSLGAGFSALKRHFITAYLSVLAIVMVNVLLIVISSWLAAAWTPQRSLMVGLFFMLTQGLFVVRLFTRAWRYATVSELALIR